MRKTARVAATALIAASMVAVPESHAGHGLDDPPLAHNGTEEVTINVAISPLGEAARCKRFHGQPLNCWQYLPDTGERVDLHSSFGDIKVFPFWKYPVESAALLRDGGLTGLSTLLSDTAHQLSTLTIAEGIGSANELAGSSADLSSDLFPEEDDADAGDSDAEYS